jgi:hypothetical protein
MPRFVICSPIHEQRRAAREREDDDDEAAGVEVQHVLRLEEERVAGRLRSRQRDGEVAGVLRDLRVACLSLFLQSLERRNDDGEDLEDDRRRDVRHDPQREEREARERRAREEVQQAEYAVTAAAEELAQRVLIDSRRRHERAEPVDGEHTGGEEQAPA